MNRAVIVALALSACGGAATPGVTSATLPVAPSASAATPAPSEKAPTPYGSEQIRAAIRPGRRLEWNIVDHGERQVHVMQFVSVDPAGSDVQITILDSTGHAVGTPARARSTWDELRDHASFPKAATQISEESVTVPAGTYPAMLYVVRTMNLVSRFWFAKTMPGPPVKMEMSEAGVVVETWELFRVLD